MTAAFVCDTGVYMAVVLLCQKGNSSEYSQYDRSDEIIANGNTIRKQAFVQRQCYNKQTCI